MHVRGVLSTLFQNYSPLSGKFMVFLQNLSKYRRTKHLVALSIIVNVSDESQGIYKATSLSKAIW